MVRVLFDTSVLIAAMVQTHSRHEDALAWMQKARKNKFTLLVSSHSLLECYSVLTRLPLKPKISPSVARQLIHDNSFKKAEMILLSSDDYYALLQECVLQNLFGGIVYDALFTRPPLLLKRIIY